MLFPANPDSHQEGIFLIYFSLSFLRKAGIHFISYSFFLDKKRTKKNQ